MDVLSLLLGWLLGLLSPQISERIKRHYQEKDSRCGIISELKEIKIRLAMTTYLLTKKTGVPDKEFLEWFKKQLEGYEGSHPTKNTLSLLEKLLTDNKQLAIFQLLSPDEEKGYSLKKFYLPFLESTINVSPIFDDKFRILIFELRSKIQALNEEIDMADFYFKKTFDSSMSRENHEIVKKNLDSAYKNINSQMKLTVEKINNLIQSTR